MLGIFTRSSSNVLRAEVMQILFSCNRRSKSPADNDFGNSMIELINGPDIDRIQHLENLSGHLYSLRPKFYGNKTSGDVNSNALFSPLRAPKRLFSNDGGKRFWPSWMSSIRPQSWKRPAEHFAAAIEDDPASRTCPLSVSWKISNLEISLVQV